jgi:hypothetical protein
MHELEFGSCDHRNLNDSEEQNQYQREDKCELDHGRACFTSHQTPFATEMTFWMTELKKAGSVSVVDAHEMRARATIAAATRTRAYSAVACPDSDFMVGLLVWVE